MQANDRTGTTHRLPSLKVQAIAHNINMVEVLMEPWSGYISPYASLKDSCLYFIYLLSFAIAAPLSLCGRPDLGLSFKLPQFFSSATHRFRVFILMPYYLATYLKSCFSLYCLTASYLNLTECDTILAKRTCMQNLCKIQTKTANKFSPFTHVLAANFYNQAE